MSPNPSRLSPVLVILLSSVLAWAPGPSTASAQTGQPEPSSTASTRLLVEVTGMTCAGCEAKLVDALTSLDFLDTVRASSSTGRACGSLTGAQDDDALVAALKGTGLDFTRATSVEVCPEGLRDAPRSPWEGRGEGLDVQVISHGEEVDVKAHLAAAKYTVVDYGASWCGPCHEAAELLEAYLGQHADVAVRAVELGGLCPEDSYKQPVVAQHLQYVKGIPWLVAHAPGGKVLAKTQSPDKVIEAIDRHRKRASK